MLGQPITHVFLRRRSPLVGLSTHSFPVITIELSTLCYFRARLGEDRFVQIFDQLVSQARRAGLVKDRLRLKDASHVVASIAVPTTLTLVAAIRDRLLSDIGPFDPDWVARTTAFVVNVKQMMASALALRAAATKIGKRET